jgi:hypothetical protein
MDDFEIDWQLAQGGNSYSNDFNTDWNNATSGNYYSNDKPGNYGGGSSSAWWDSPGGSSGAPITITQPAGGYYPSIGMPPTFNPAAQSFGGSGTNAQGNYGLASSNTGSFSGSPIAAPGANPLTISSSPAGNAGVTGDFGVSQNDRNFDQDWADMQGGRFSINDTPQTPQQALQQQGPGFASRAWDATGGAVGRGLSAVGTYAQQNPWAARFAVDAAGLGLGYLNQREANKLAKEQLQLQRETQARNNAIADRLNAESTQSLNEARSLYNPQEMGIRAMATEQGNRQTAMNDAAAQMRRRGMSQAAIDAELRRARVGGSTSAATAYTKGLDVGRTAQQSALTSAKGLSQQYGGTPNYGGAEMASKAGAMNTAQMQNLLNTYLYDPVGRTNAQVIDEQQRRVGQS